MKGGIVVTNESKFCEFCGSEVHVDAVMCPKCGRQLEKLKTDLPDMVSGDSSSAITVTIISGN